MDHFDLSFAIWKLSRNRELKKPTLLDPDHFPGRLSQSSPCVWAAHMRRCLHTLYFEFNSGFNYETYLRNHFFLGHRRTEFEKSRFRLSQRYCFQFQRPPNGAVLIA